MRLHAVRCRDYGDPNGEWTMRGFAGAGAARRAIRARIEHMRAGMGPAEELEEMYRSFGDHARTSGLHREAWAAPCIANPTCRQAGIGTLAPAPRGGA